MTLAGSTFNLVRVYDSLMAAQSGTFGYGWRLASQDMDIQTTVPPTGQESDGIYNPFRVGTRVYLTLPDRPARRVHLRAGEAHDQRA